MNATVVNTIETAEDANKKAVHSDMISPRFYTTDFAAMTASTLNPSVQSGTR
jgi:magnesium-protoporphyrin IX monomethyl ester (oxidative) cyclase